MATPQAPIPPTAPRDKDKRKLGLIALILVIVAGLVTGAGLFLVNRTADSPQQIAIFSDTPVEPPVFEPRGDRGDDPFFPLEVQLAGFRAETEAANGAPLTDAQVQELDGAKS